MLAAAPAPAARRPRRASGARGAARGPAATAAPPAAPPVAPAPAPAAAALRRRRREVVRGQRAPTEHRRPDQPAQAGVDVLQLGGQQPARPARREVRVHPGPAPPGQPAARPGAEPLDREAAALTVRVRQVFLQIRLPQPLAGPVGQRGHPVRREAEHRRHLGRRLLLHLGVPEHGLPALRQPGERAGRQPRLEPGDRRVLPRHPGVVPAHVVRQLQPAVPADPVVQRVAQRGEQVRPEREVRAAAVAQRVEHLRERLGDQVVPLRGGAGQLAGQVVRRGGVPAVERPVRVPVALPDGGDEVRIARPVELTGLHARERDGHAGNSDRPGTSDGR